MTSNFEMSRSIQIFQHDLLEAVTRFPSPGSSDEQLTMDSFSTPSSSSVLFGAHVRVLLLKTMVRVRVPFKRRTALLHSNPYHHQIVEHWRQQRKQRGGGSSSPSQQQQQAEEEEHFSFRVGRVEAILPKPQAAAAAAEGPSSPASWLIAVDLGETVCTFPLMCVDENHFREDEFRLWLRCASRPLSSSPSAASGSSGKVMSAEAVAQVLHQLQIVRDVITQEKQRASGLQEGQKVRLERANESSASSATKTTTNGDESSGVEGVCESTRLRALIEVQETNLQQLRQLVSRKDSEVGRLLTQQRLESAAHSDMVQRIEDKLRECAEAQRKAEQLVKQKEHLHEEQLQAGKERLVKMSQLTKRYQDVYSQVVRVLNTSGHTSEKKDWKLDQVLEVLKNAKSIE